ncbi:CPBP family intramembrane metalloprotease domain-containing protein [Bacillus pumilus]|uniref:CPBP family intramembrane metalloprotease domain-containing protein n=1 Tax=Bacillus pumilus TaxID=1408 RepID=A0A2A5J1J2_BACPU|nr:CPBP family intramembrane glutamic endopeptidase [Bacillus pumilus]PCK23450.1 CPBP family intramembrane metalloprotease domain-containing protein [Bacillus pumilus]
MNSFTFILWTGLGVIGLVLFMKYRVATIESNLLDKSEARKVSIDFMKEFVGLDVEEWDVYSVYWYDHETVNKLHHLGLLNKNRRILHEMGLVESWRVRFVHQHQSFVIGVNTKREVTFFYADVRQTSLSKKAGQLSPEGLKDQLTCSSTGLWAKTKSTGSGSKEEDFREINTYWYLAEKEDVRLKVTVEMQSGVITYIGTDTEILTDKMNKVIRDEQVESTFGISGMLASAAAMVMAILVLVLMDVQTQIILSLILGLIIVLVQSLTIKEDIQLTIVNAYDARMNVQTVRLLGMLSTMLAGLLTGFVVFICSLAGGALANELGLTFLDRISVQFFIGLSGGLISLGITSLVFFLLERMNRLRISPELSNRSMFLSGFTLRQGLNMSLQSSIGEEVIYRLLMISLIFWLSGSTMLSILLSSLLWAIMHQVTGYDPRWIRWAHLFVFGCFLGFLFVNYGFICVLAAHFIHNLVLVCMPLWQFKLQRYIQTKKPQHTSL